MSSPRQSEIHFLLGAFALAASAGAFLALATWVERGTIEDFDRHVVLAFRDPTHPEQMSGPEWARDAIRDVTALGSLTVLGFVLALAIGFLGVARAPRAVLWLLVTSLAGSACTFALKGWIARPRPEMAALHFHRTMSFPSGHAALSAVLYLTLAALLVRVLPSRALKLYVLSTATLICVLVGISRVALGMHYPSDVLAGWVLGSGWASLSWVGTIALQRRGAVEVPGDTARAMSEDASEPATTSANP